MVGGCPAREVEQDATADNAVFFEVLDPEDVGLGLGAWCGAGDVIDRGVVVEALRGLVAEVAEAIPLRGGLRVEVPCVVVDYAWFLLVDVLLEDLAAEEGPLAFIL